jgi:hypothetical protein
LSKGRGDRGRAERPFGRALLGRLEPYSYLPEKTSVLELPYSTKYSLYISNIQNFLLLEQNHHNIELFCDFVHIIRQKTQKSTQ